MQTGERQRQPEELLHGLLIDTHALELILAGRKTWELHRKRSTYPKQVALIRKGSGWILGTADLVEVIGPLSLADLQRSVDKHCAPLDRLDDAESRAKTYAWVLANVRRLPRPVAYTHPRGAIIWVRLARAVSEQVLSGAAARHARNLATAASASEG